MNKSSFLILVYLLISGCNSGTNPDGSNAGLAENSDPDMVSLSDGPELSMNELLLTEGFSNSEEVFWRCNTGNSELDHTGNLNIRFNADGTGRIDTNQMEWSYDAVTGTLNTKIASRRSTLREVTFRNRVQPYDQLLFQDSTDISYTCEWHGPPRFLTGQDFFEDEPYSLKTAISNSGSQANIVDYWQCDVIEADGSSSSLSLFFSTNGYAEINGENAKWYVVENDDIAILSGTNYTYMSVRKHPRISGASNHFTANIKSAKLTCNLASEI